MTTHTLDGPDLEALLARVPAELGPDATIVAANKLRTGGLGGFFAKERFEVVVEVPDDDGAAPGGDPTTLVGSGGPRVSTEAIGFAGVLDRMVRDAGGADTAPRSVGPGAGRLRAGPDPTVAEAADDVFEPLQPERLDGAGLAGPLTDGAGAVQGGSVALAADDRPVQSGLEAVAAGAVAIATASGAAAGLGVSGPPAAQGTAGDATVTGSLVASVVAPSVTGGQPAAGLVAHEALSPATEVVAGRRSGAAGPSPAAPGSEVAPMASTRPVPAGPVLDQRALTWVGLPSNVAAHLPETGGSDPTVALYQLMDRLALPEALPTMAGSVIAVVGERQAAMAVLERFADQLGTEADDILVAARRRTAGVAEEQRLATAEQACERRRSWRRRRRPTLVAIDAAMTRNGRPWAHELLDALEPTMVWGVVDASRKPEDVRDWAERLGGLDALAVVGLNETVSPAAILGAGIPVGLLDHDEASAARWTAILAERLELAA